MADDKSNGSSKSVAIPVSSQRRRTPLPFIILALLFVIVPFLTWYLTWFNRPLSDETIGQYLSDEKNVRHVQHALTLVEEKIEKGDAGVKRWYPQIVALSNSNVVEIRKTSAWVMGQDNTADEFHAALLKLIGDENVAVRRNAAVQLVRFGDASGRAELRATLQPYNLLAPVEGTITSVLVAGGTVSENSLVARITTSQNQVQEIRSPLPGKLTGVTAHEGVKVSQSDVILTIAPDSDFVYEALRALWFVGEAEDLPDVERYARGVEGMPERVKQQAAQTLKAIRSRSESKNPGVKQ